MDKILKMKDYLKQLKEHLEDEDQGSIKYKLYSTADTDSLWNRYEEYIVSNTNDIFFTNYHLFIIIVDKTHYYKLFYSAGNLPVYLIQTLQQRINSLK